MVWKYEFISKLSVLGLNLPIAIVVNEVTLLVVDEVSLYINKFIGISLLMQSCIACTIESILILMLRYQ